MKIKPLSEYPKIVCTVADLKHNKGGVYFLYNSDGLQYIGQSENVARRIKAHPVLRGLDKSSWRVEVVRVYDYGKRRRLEQYCIEYFRPPLNKIKDYKMIAAKIRETYARILRRPVDEVFED